MTRRVAYILPPLRALYVYAIAGHKTKKTLALYRNPVQAHKMTMLIALYIFSLVAD
jgi:hypothetical protein